MIKCKEIINDVELSYHNLNVMREFNLSVLNEKLMKNDKYSETSKNLSEAIFDLNKAEFNGETEKVEKLQKEIQRLKETKLKLVDKSGLNTVKYRCDLCKDSGFIGEKRCRCFYKYLTDACYRELNQQVPNLYTFNDDTMSKKQGTTKHFEKLKKYADNFSSTSKNLIFTGKTGTGKTFLSQAIASEIANNGNVSLFLTSSALNNIAIENMYSSPSAAKTTNDILETCDFLVIDDLGAERLLNKITLENLYVLISARLENQKPFLVTTNLTFDELAARYGDRLFSRLTSNKTVTINFDGQDLRK